ncbi:NAD(P)-binding domain-containing protein [Conexibacter woesei]|uniref:6-phosphogluconate dehydrogenase NAD-binding protein n=1 Tax=Conexibacter woesei (strain DSM 14684 / CCUG 47730 / CIP 108061 / JCM 11494 / NBRC 100937 / ID131577) TaxID=469383 RepID=D3FBX8_CONWI|nr:NAD(P)-binding domain-containing protein [Conexibacter woesei]ADB51393.1 6-phosphogluconate dehydrogenase NAD-binding protein [Conexibacter woesei DSM 14684]
MTTIESERVAVLGLGAMGRALAGALLAAGRPVTVWNRTAGKADELVARGAREAASASEAIVGTDLAVVCLLDDSTVRDTLGPIAGELSGRTIVNLTSGSPQQARDQAAWVAAHGAAYLDGGILAVPPTVGTPGAFLLYSGARDLFARVEQAVAPLGRPLWVGEDHGHAALYDIAALSGMYGLSAGAHHAVALVAAVGGDVEAFKRDVLLPWLEQMMPFSAGGAEASETIPEEYNAAMQATGLQTMIDASSEVGVADELAGHLHASLWAMRRALAVSG